MRTKTVKVVRNRKEVDPRVWYVVGAVIVVLYVVMAIVEAVRSIISWGITNALYIVLTLALSGAGAYAWKKRNEIRDWWNTKPDEVADAVILPRTVRALPQGTPKALPAKTEVRVLGFTVDKSPVKRKNP